MQKSITVWPRHKPLVPCVGCGTYIAKYSDVEKGHVYADDERGYVCVLCRKTVCDGCVMSANIVYQNMYKSHAKLRQEYGMYQASIQSAAHEDTQQFACKRCVAEFEMGLINKVGYADLPLYLHHNWLTAAARKYFDGILQGRYECPTTHEMT